MPVLRNGDPIEAHQKAVGLFLLHIALAISLSILKSPLKGFLYTEELT